MDQYGRLLRYVHVGDRNVNLELVRRGAAAPYFFHGEHGRYASELENAGEAARDAGRGMWGACRVAWNPERSATARAALKRSVGAGSHPAREPAPTRRA